MVPARSPHALLGLALLAPLNSQASAQESESPAVTAEVETVESTDPKSTTWTDHVDQFFGKYIVAPMEKVIFFDFWTEDWLGSKVPFIVFWLLAGATFFTFRMGFFNIRGFKHAIQLTRGDYDKPGETGEVSHFQALSSALSATVGLGNIAGVAIAIGMGGPGACLWMIVIGFLGFDLNALPGSCMSIGLAMNKGCPV